jgi:serine/threonine protein kinase
MEYVPGEDLKSFIRRSGQLVIGTTIRIAKQICEGLASAHKLGVIHRDLKPANIMIDKEGNTRIMDFGIARSIKAKSITGSGVMIGTPEYMSPEQVEGKEVDQRSDIYSLGVILFEMVIGRVPFEGDTPLSIAYKHKHETPQDPRKINALINDDLSQIILRCMEKDREKRYQSSEELHIDLESLKGDTDSAQVSVTREVAPRPDRKTSRHNKTAIIISTLAIVVVIIGFVLWWQAQVSTPAPSIVTPEQLTSNPIEASVSGAAISPDGKYLAYSDHTGLYVRLIETGETHLLELPKGFQAWDVDWYPDGNKLLVNGISPESDMPGLWKISILGGSPRQLHKGGLTPSVSPDGSHIAFVHADTTTKRAWREIFIMGANGEDKHPLIIAGKSDSFWLLGWSPDSKRVAFGNWSRTHEGGNFSIETCRLGDSERTTMITDSRLFQSWTGILPFVWSQDGRFIYARRELSPNTESSNLWAVQTDLETGRVVGEPVRITQMAGFNFQKLRLTSDGKRLIALLVRNQADVYVAELDEEGTLLKNERRLTFDERHDYIAGWSRDSRVVLFESRRGGTGDIFKQDIEQKTAEVVVAGPGRQYYRDTSPQGEWIFYESGNILMRFHISGGPPEKVSEIKGLVHCSSPPSATCIWSELDEEKNQLVFSTFDPIQGRGNELARIKARPPFNNWALSPDGTQVAVVHNDDNRIRVITLLTGEEKEVYVKDWSGFEFISWAADGKGFYVNGGDAKGISYPALLYIDMNGQAKALRQNPYEWHIKPFLSPDGRYLAFSTMPFHGNVWMIEGF